MVLFNALITSYTYLIHSRFNKFSKKATYLRLFKAYKQK